MKKILIWFLVLGLPIWAVAEDVHRGPLQVTGDLTVGGTATASNLSNTNTGDEVSATETTEGLGEIATSAEVIALLDSFRWITPATLKALFDLGIEVGSLTIIGNDGDFFINYANSGNDSTNCPTLTNTAEHWGSKCLAYGKGLE